MKVAITGGIGSGKSYVCGLLCKRCIRIYDCDSAAKRLMHSNKTLQEKLKTLIGEDTFVNGQLNKPKVAQFLLASKSNSKAINSIVHPFVANDFVNSEYDWMECAILYESGFDKLIDKVIVVTAPIDVRIKRIVQRDNISEAKAKEWIGKQLPQEELAKRADYEIVNDGKKDIDLQINRILKEIENNIKQ